MDAKQASETARDYFITIHGTFAVWAFEVESVDYDNERKAWVIDCSFRRNQYGPERYRYRVTVEPEEGTVREVKRIQKASRA